MGIFDFFHPDEADIIANKRAGRIYVADFQKGEGKYISTVIEEGTDPYDLSIKISPKIDVRITYISDEEKIVGVQISKLSGSTVEKIHLSTLGFRGVLGLLQIFSGLELKSVANRSILLDSQIVHDEEALRAHLNTLLSDERGLKMLAELATSKGIISEGDIGNISKKREALDLFKQLLTDDNFFAQKRRNGARLKTNMYGKSFLRITNGYLVTGWNMYSMLPLIKTDLNKF